MSSNDNTAKLPDAPSLAWLRKHAKRKLKDLRETYPQARLADAQLELARQYGFSNWRALKAHLDAVAIDGKLFEAARQGAVEDLERLLNAHPEKATLREKPYNWSLLHFAARHARLGAVDLLLKRGVDPNTVETGDNTYPMHWAAAAGALDVVQRLEGAGGDVVGRGDDHELEIIGWATCWDDGGDDNHRAVADFLVSKGAKHHIFSAIALNLEDEVRRIVKADPSAVARRQSRSDNHRTPLHFAVMKNRPSLVVLLLDLGADPLAIDGDRQPVAACATTPTIDLPVMERIRAMAAAELLSARRANRAPKCSSLELAASLAVGDWNTATLLLHAAPELIAAEGGALHLLAKRGDLAAAAWLLERGADVNGRWRHWDGEVTPLHLAVMQRHLEMISLLLQHGADPRQRDSQFDSDALGWAEHFQYQDVEAMLKGAT